MLGLSVYFYSIDSPYAQCYEEFGCDLSIVYIATQSCHIDETYFYFVLDVLDAFGNPFHFYYVVDNWAYWPT